MLKKFRGVDLCGEDRGGNGFAVVKGMRALAIGVMDREWDVKMDSQEIVEELCEDAGMSRVFPDVIQ